MSEISKIDQQILYLIKLFENKNFDEVISQSSNLFKENKKLSDKKMLGSEDVINLL